jgi:hypothetical protein
MITCPNCGHDKTIEELRELLRSLRMANVAWTDRLPVPHGYRLCYALSQCDGEVARVLEEIKKINKNNDAKLKEDET